MLPKMKLPADWQDCSGYQIWLLSFQMFMQDDWVIDLLLYVHVRVRAVRRTVCCRRCRCCTCVYVCMSVVSDDLLSCVCVCMSVYLCYRDSLEHAQFSDDLMSCVCVCVTVYLVYREFLEHAQFSDDLLSCVCVCVTVYLGYRECLEHAQFSDDLLSCVCVFVCVCVWQCVCVSVLQRVMSTAVRSTQGVHSVQCSVCEVVCMFVCVLYCVLSDIIFTAVRVCMCVVLLAHISGQTERIFMKILQWLKLWTRKFLINFVSHPVPKAGSYHHMLEVS